MNRLALIAVLAAGCTGGPEKSVYDLSADDFAEQRQELATVQADACSGGDCVPVKEGDILLVTASGSLSSELGTTGPEGAVAWGGTPFSFVNRPAFALMGRIGESELLLGSENVIIAPASGNLRIGVNRCSPDMGFGCPTATGQFAVAIHSVLKPGTKVSTTPSLADTTVLQTQSFGLALERGWQRSGVTVDKGQKVFIRAPGSFQATPFNGTPTQFTANGDPSGALGGTAYLLGNRFGHKLYARIGTTVIELGTSSAFLAPATGELEFVINHQAPAADTSGTLAIEIDQGVRPARGLFPQDVAGFSQSDAVTVAADGQWIPTNVTARVGEPLVFRATGQLNGAGDTKGAFDAFGEGGVGGAPYPLVNRPRFALFARVKQQVFLVGTATTVLAPDSGPVELIVNARPSDAMQGAFSATVRAP